MFLTKKGSFSQELSLEPLQVLSQEIKLAAEKFHSPDQVIDQDYEEVKELLKDSGKRLHMSQPDEILKLTLDDLLSRNSLLLIRKIAEDYRKGCKLGKKVSEEYIYKELARILGRKDFYLLDRLDIKNVNSLFEELKNNIDCAISPIKIVIVPVVGASLRKGEKCTIGSVEFIHPENFLESCLELISLENKNENLRTWKILNEVCKKSNLIAKIKIKNRTDDLARSFGDEVIKRVYTLIRFILPTLGDKYSFIDTLGEEYLERRYSLVLHLAPVCENDVLSIAVGQTRNFFASEEVNLAEIVSNYRAKVRTNPNELDWFNACERIASKLIENEEINDFEERVWTALYWFGEAMFEREISSLIVKYATCLEALFNSNEGGISEQIAEFTAFVVGSNKEQRINVYEAIKTLYNLRSATVHGRSIMSDVDRSFLSRIKIISQLAVQQMSYYSGESHWQSSRGYRDFVNYLLKEYRFSSGSG
jgi:hypothetical protein